MSAQRRSPAESATEDIPSAPSAFSPTDPPRPEEDAVHSLSHPGRAMWHHFKGKRRVVARAQMLAKLPQDDVVQEEQLIYMALYRDKIAQHQARLAASAAKGGIPSEGAKLTGPGARRAGDRTASSATGHAASHRVGRSDPAAAAPAPAREAAVTGGGAGAASSLPTARYVTGGDVAGERELFAAKTTAHIASVVAAPAHGGVTSEHLETKQLGRLFDQWCEQQAEEAACVATPANRTPRNGSVPKEQPGGSRIVSAARKGKARDPQSGTAQVGAGIVGGEHNTRGSALGLGGGDAIGTDGGRSLRTERLFSVITNPKVLCHSFTERCEGRPRHDDTHIQGFPTLNRMKLHKGPWRLEF